MKKLIVILTPLLLMGCYTTKSFNARSASTTSMLQTCMASIPMEAPEPQMVFTDARDQAIVIMARALSEQNKVNPVDYCTKMAMASINSDANLRSAMVRAGTSVATIGLGVWGLASVADSFADLGAQKGNATYSNSRVLDSSEGGSISSSSASGETTNFGTVSGIDGSAVQGGIQPRQAMIESSEAIESPSQSGEDAPIQFGDEVTAMPAE